MRLPLNDLCTTERFGLSRRCSFIGAGIQAASNAAISAATNVTNASIAKQTNDTNERIQNSVNETNVAMNEANNALQQKIADEVNALNYKIFTEQNDFNVSMWDKQNEYNSPEAQMKRLIDAGINPNMLGGGSSNVTGVATDSPSSSQYAGAQMADVNPSRIEAMQKDPYKLVPFNLDFLGPASVAAGISKTQSETDALDLQNKFDASTFGTREEAETARLKFVLSQVDSLNETTDFNRGSRKFQLRKMQLANKLDEVTLKSLNQEFDRRKAEFAEWKQMSKVRKQTAIFSLRKIVEEIKHLDSDQVHQRALEKHWTNQDQISKEQVSLYRQGLLFDKLRTAKDLYLLNPVSRQNIAAAIASDDDGLEKFISSLDGAADGNYNTWLNAALHSEAGSKLMRLLDAFISEYVPETE